MSIERRVKGVLFLDYVRMLRACKGVVWGDHLPPQDVQYLHEHIEPAGWYPMATFERMGDQILRVVARGDLFAVRLWGRLSVDHLRAAQPQLVAAGDPIETISRFRVLRSTYFDFDALEVQMLYDEVAQIAVHYHMGATAEEAASHQTMGFFERLVEISGATEVTATFRERSWAGDARTILSLTWRTPVAPSTNLQNPT